MENNDRNKGIRTQHLFEYAHRTRLNRKFDNITNDDMKGKIPSK